MSNNKINNNNNNIVVAEPDYFFLYDKSFLGFEPPMNAILFCIAPSVLYLLCVFYIFPAVAPKTKYGVLLIDKLRYFHNMFLFLYSGFSCAVAVYSMIIANEFHFWSFKIEDMKPMLCQEPSNFLKLVNYTFIASKLYEMLDTAFIVWLKNDNARAILKAEKDDKKRQKMLKAGKSESEISAALAPRKSAAPVAGAEKKKQPSEAAELSFLHLYHHCTTFWLFLLVADLPGTTKLGPLMNGFVHTLMYLHYAHPLPMPFLITIAQIFQLGFVTWSWYLVVTHCDAYKSFPEKHFYEYWTNYLFVPVYFVFFVKFFFERFILGMFKSKKTVKTE